jgi:hypothetical protein
VAVGEVAAPVGGGGTAFGRIRTIAAMALSGEVRPLGTKAKMLWTSIW